MHIKFPMDFRAAKPDETETLLFQQCGQSFYLYSSHNSSLHQKPNGRNEFMSSNYLNAIKLAELYNTLIMITVSNVLCERSMAMMNGVTLTEFFSFRSFEEKKNEKKIISKQSD